MRAPLSSFINNPHTPTKALWASVLEAVNIREHISINVLLLLLPFNESFYNLATKPLYWLLVTRFKANQIIFRHILPCCQQTWLSTKSGCSITALLLPTVFGGDAPLSSVLKVCSHTHATWNCILTHLSGQCAQTCELVSFEASLWRPTSADDLKASLLPPIKQFPLIISATAA